MLFIFSGEHSYKKCFAFFVCIFLSKFVIILPLKSCVSKVLVGNNYRVCLLYFALKRWICIFFEILSGK